jgi:hypothetical protein
LGPEALLHGREGIRFGLPCPPTLLTSREGGSEIVGEVVEGGRRECLKVYYF